MFRFLIGSDECARPESLHMIRNEKIFPLHLWNKVNSIWNYRGRRAGEAHLLVRKSVRDAIASGLSPVEITIDDPENGADVATQGWTVVKCEAIESYQDDEQLYYVELRDRRWIGEQVKIHNTYESIEWDAYHSIDWEDAIGKLWDLLPTDAKGLTVGTPALVTTPTSHAEFLNFDGLSVWQALCQCLQAVGHFPVYSMIHDTFAFAKYNTTQSGLAALISANAANLIWDGNIPAVDGSLPETIKVTFNPLVPTAKSMRWYRQPVAKSVASGLSNVVAGSVMTIVDHQLAIVDKDTILNDTQLDNRLADMTPTIKGICRAFNDQSVKTYNLNITDFACGSEVSCVVWSQHNRQGVYTQVIHSEELKFDMPRHHEPIDTPHVLFGKVLGAEGITGMDGDVLGTGTMRVYQTDVDGNVTEFTEVNGDGGNWDLTVYTTGSAVPEDQYIQVIREYTSGAWLVVTGGGGSERIYFKILEILDSGDVTSENINDRVVASVEVLGIACSGATVAVGDTVEVADEAMCFFVEGEDFTDRRGFATKFIVANESGSGPPLSECHWVVDGLCC